MVDEQKPLILIVDDDPDIRTILHTKLESLGYRIVEATNGQEGIDAAKKEKPALIVMDVRMPVMSGTEAIGRIGEDSSLHDIKVVFLSNFGEEEEVNAWIDEKFARELGAVGYMKKTDDLSKITAKIQELLNG